MTITRIILAALALLIVVAVVLLYSPDKSRAALEAKYAGPPSTFMEVAGLRMHIRDTGPKDAPAIILLHGFGSSLHTWQDWATDLETSYRVIRFDLPGFGLTGPDPTNDYTDARSIDLLLSLMNGLGVAQATIVGNSMGGRIAWMFAATHPERVKKLVLISPDGFASPGIAYGETPKLPLVMRILPYVLPTPMLRATLAPAYANASVMSDDLVARYRDMMLAPGVRQAILARMAQMKLEDPVPLLHRIQAPTLILWGKEDKMIPFSNASDYVAAIPNATLVALPTLGHVPFEEAPEVSIVPLKSFLLDREKEAQQQ